MIIKEKIVDLSENTEIIIEREMTPEEFAEYEFNEAKRQAELIDLEAKEAARQALLDKLGITADEAKLLLG